MLVDTLLADDALRDFLFIRYFFDEVKQLRSEEFDGPIRQGNRNPGLLSFP